MKTVQCGITGLSHDQSLHFNEPFLSTPVIVTSSSIAGRPISSAAADCTPNGFRIILTNDQGKPASDATVQWIAFIPTPAANIYGSSVDTSHGQHISVAELSTSLPAGLEKADLSERPLRPPIKEYLPAIVTNAYRGNIALVSGAARNYTDGFDLDLFDHCGNPVDDATVVWAAFDRTPGVATARLTVPVPNEEQVARDAGPAPREAFCGNYWLSGKDGDKAGVSPPFKGEPVYVLSAASGARAVALNNERKGFTLCLTRNDGTPA